QSHRSYSHTGPTVTQVLQSHRSYSHTGPTRLAGSLQPVRRNQKPHLPAAGLMFEQNNAGLPADDTS
ncbi:MAG: hypothetical protein OSA98_20835, partial [Rubripirellula sp.]|nr:hypothetical protein [Rubripirellula sp.]